MAAHGDEAVGAIWSLRSETSGITETKNAECWLIQARMAGAIARIYGHELHTDRVRTMILLSLAKEAVKSAGIKLGQKLTEPAIAHIPGRALVEINKRIGFRLLTKAGERGIVNSKQFPWLRGLWAGLSTPLYVAQWVALPRPYSGRHSCGL